MHDSALEILLQLHIGLTDYIAKVTKKAETATSAKRAQRYPPATGYVTPSIT